MRGQRRLMIGCVAATALGLALAGCSSGGSSTAGPTTTVTSTATVTATVTATPSAPPSASATTSAASNGCASSALAATVRELDSGAGQRYAAIVVTNVSAKPCTLKGYPGLQLTTKQNAAIPTKVNRVASPAARSIKLAPGAKASSQISFSVIPSGSEPDTGNCEPDPRHLLVIPPNQTTSVSALWTLGPVCGKGAISAKAFVAGSGG